MRLLLFVVSRLAVVFYLHQWHASSRYAERKAQLNGGVEAHYSYWQKRVMSMQRIDWEWMRGINTELIVKRQPNDGDDPNP